MDMSIVLALLQHIISVEIIIKKFFFFSFF